MAKKINSFDMVKNHLSIVALCRELEHQLYRIDLIVRPNAGAEYSSAYSVIHSAIYAKELEAWRTVAMMTLAGTDEQQKEVRSLAYRRFFDAGKSVMYLTDDIGEQPLSWASSDEREVRDWLRENFLEESQRQSGGPRR